MGKMKEIFTEIIENEYRGDYSAYIEDLARQTCEEYIPMDEHEHVSELQWLVH